MKTFRDYIKEVSASSFLSKMGDISSLSSKEAENLNKLISVTKTIAYKNPHRLLNLLRQVHDDELQDKIDEIDPSLLRSSSIKMDDDEEPVMNRGPQQKDFVVMPPADARW